MQSTGDRDLMKQDGVDFRAQDVDREESTKDQAHPKPPTPMCQPTTRVVLGTHTLEEVEGKESSKSGYSTENTTFGEVPRQALRPLQGQRHGLEQGHLQKPSEKQEQDVEQCRLREQE